MEKLITTPLSDEVVKTLKAGDRVYISGKIYTARDAAHKRMTELLLQGEKLPVNLENQIVYYVGPTPAKPGQIIGSAGPTTSGRMDAYTPALLELGLKGMIGKGSRNDDVVSAMIKNNAVYFAAIGGAGALIAKCIKKAQVVAYEDLGTEAVMELEVHGLPVVVAIDCTGKSIYDEK